MTDKNVNLNAIRIDGGTQSRVRLDESIVAEYAGNLDAMPSVVLFHDGADYWLADGFHRFHAWRQAERASIPAHVYQGTRRDAVLFSLGANGTHGLRRTNEDKRKSVQTLLEDAEWAQWSDRKIAEVCGVTHPFVAGIRSPKVVTVTTPAAGKSAPNRPEDRIATPRPQPTSSAPTVTVPPPADDYGPDAAEIAANDAAEAADRAALNKLLESDDKLATAVAEVKRLNLVNAAQQSRINGLMAEKNEAVRLAKSWQRKFNEASKGIPA